MTSARIAISILLALPAFAGIAGRWDVTSTTADGEQIKTLLVVAENGGKLDVALTLRDQKIPVSNIAFADDQLTFRLMWGETGVNLKAKLDGDKLAGNWVADSGDTGPIAAVRIAEAAAGSNAFYTGKWKLTVSRPDRDPIKVDLELKDEGGKWSGSIVTPDGMQVPATVAMDNGNLTITIDAGSAVYTLKLAKDGEGMKGTVAGPDGAIPLVAVR